MKNKLLKFFYIVTGILFAASCQNDNSEDIVISPAQSIQPQNIERVILPMEGNSTELPPFYLSEIIDGKEILTPMRQVPPVLNPPPNEPPGGDELNPGDGFNPTTEVPVFEANLYFEIGEVREFNNGGGYGAGGETTYLWDWNGTNDFLYTIIGGTINSKLKITALRSTTTNSNWALLNVYKRNTFYCDSCSDGQGGLDNMVTIYTLTSIYRYTLITYPLTIL
ncbi:MAG: hypothetical protein LBT56_07085 [Prevotellaceae bacterium]|jgi:hypothetical protein|nr:hypothetical protein [Prevotellaceae bacterium]